MDIFCRIINHEIPNYTVYEDDTVLAFLDIAQATKGHTLVIPKKHYDTFLDVPSEEAAHLIEVTQMLAKKIMRATGATGCNILNNTNEVAGQTVMHAHIHIIPRYSEQDDVVFAFKEKDNTLDMNALVASIVNEK